MDMHGPSAIINYHLARSPIEHGHSNNIIQRSQGKLRSVRAIIP
jgi:hypothetical protein